MRTFKTLSGCDQHQPVYEARMSMIRGELKQGRASAAEYCLNFRRMAMWAGISGDIACDRLLAGLNHDLRLMCMSPEHGGSWTDLESCIRFVVNREEFLRKFGGGVPKAKSSAAIVAPMQARSKRTDGCFLCSAPDHIARNCPKNRGRTGPAAGGKGPRGMKRGSGAPSDGGRRNKAPRA